MRSFTTLALLVALCAATAAAGRTLEGDAAAPAGVATPAEGAAAAAAGSLPAGDAADCVYTAAPQPPTIGIDSRMFNGATFAWWLPPVTPACLSFVQYQVVEGKGKPSDGGYANTEPEGWRYGYLTQYVEPGGAKKLTVRGAAPRLPRALLITRVRLWGPARGRGGGGAPGGALWSREPPQRAPPPSPPPGGWCAQLTPPLAAPPRPRPAPPRPAPLARPQLYMRSIQVSPSNVTRYSRVAKKSYALFKG
jgi:hypothetical protein